MTAGKIIPGGVKETREVMNSRLVLAKTYIRTQVRRDGKYITEDLHSLTDEINNSLAGKKEFKEFGRIS